MPAMKMQTIKTAEVLLIGFVLFLSVKTLACITEPECPGCQTWDEIEEECLDDDSECASGHCYMEACVECEEDGHCDTCQYCQGSNHTCQPITVDHIDTIDGATKFLIGQEQMFNAITNPGGRQDHLIWDTTDADSVFVDPEHWFHATWLIPGFHMVTASCGRPPPLDELVVTVTSVDTVTPDRDAVCLDDPDGILFTATSIPSDSMNEFPWEVWYKNDINGSWTIWGNKFQEGPTWRLYPNQYAGAAFYQIRIQKGVIGEYAVSEEVAAVSVDKIEIEFSGWHDVTGSTITLMQGTKYQFRAIPNPTGAPWPENFPTWSGIATGSGSSIDVILENNGTFELKASCCGSEKKVTINVITPLVDEVTYGGGNFSLTRLNDSGGGVYTVAPVEVPEYKREPSGPGTYRANPACWKVGSDATATVKFWHSDSLSFPAPNIVVRAETSGDGFNIGDWGDSPTTTWINWSTEVTCPAERTIDNTVQLQDYWAQWRYKCTTGSNSWINVEAPNVSGSTAQPSKLYVVLDTPQDPQSLPWVELLDHACGSIAEGADDKAEAMEMIWDKFYYDAGGVYDTIDGSCTYGGTNFKLVSWLDSYGSVGTVNCHDMAQAEVIYANALGCSAMQTFVSPFGYLNCIKPIGCGWTNNPFYDAGSPIDSNPIVNGDWNILLGRSYFWNHSFASMNSNIYDASVGRVDDDSDPDDPPHPLFPHKLNGDDTWASNYKLLVIDNLPVVATGTPATVTFNVIPE